MLSDLFYPSKLDESIRHIWGCLVFISFYHLCFSRNAQLPDTNSVDPDQTPRFATSDLGLYCLPMSLLWDVGTNGLTL